MSAPFFSCVMAVKGARPFMDEALNSLTTQELGDELEIVIQDGDLKSDRGLSDALNKGFAKCRGEWMFWLNADDVLLPGTLKAVKELIERRKTLGRATDWIAGGSKYIDKNGVVIGRKFDRRFHPWLYRHMWVWTSGPSSFFSRKLWESAGGLDVRLRCMMDMDLWTRWARAGYRFEVLKDFAWGFRCHEGSITTGGGHEAEMLADMKIVGERYRFKHGRLWLNLHRASRVIDGSIFKR